MKRVEFLGMKVIIYEEKIIVLITKKKKNGQVAGYWVRLEKYL